MTQEEMKAFIIKHDDGYTLSAISDFDHSHLQSICDRINAELKSNLNKNPNGKNERTVHGGAPSGG